LVVSREKKIEHERSRTLAKGIPRMLAVERSVAIAEYQCKAEIYDEMRALEARFVAEYMADPTKPRPPSSPRLDSWSRHQRTESRFMHLRPSDFRPENDR
jgi:hypothetical protein